MQVDFTKRVLPNGLPVIVHEDHHCPIVGVSVWYHVGSQDERPGRTGFAHLFEHLMFEGSEHQDGSYFQPLQQAGASLNGSTSTDRTNYWEVVPTNALELALWMESDRMGCLLPALTQRKFENQREVVLNERRQNYENRPYGLAPVAMSAALFPPDHPYHWLTIGWPEDLRAATLDEVHAFFATYYHPGNASLALAGDVDPDRAFALVEDCFGAIPAAARPPRTLRRASLPAERRLVLEDRVELPRLYMAWHTPGLFQDGDADLDLAGDILGSGKPSRLYRTLVFDRRVAIDAAAGQNSRELSSLFQVTATAAPDHSLAELEQLVTAEIDRVAAHGPTESELERGLARAEAAFVFRLQHVGGFGGRSDQLNAYNIYLGDPGFFARDWERYTHVTPASIRDIVQRDLRPDARVVLSVVPRGRLDLAVSGSEPIHVS
ncbi:MAG: insulinase family protein [Acidobacteria bacterium]|nr:insulinase family protein [Acidobacteriota bacterium]MBI3262785.1 insulinase family protein [Acidobacteriota bacterium]